MERKRITKGELAILRLVAGQTVLKLATEKIYEHLIDHVSFGSNLSSPPPFPRDLLQVGK